MVEQLSHSASPSQIRTCGFPGRPWVTAHSERAARSMHPEERHPRCGRVGDDAPPKSRWQLAAGPYRMAVSLPIPAKPITIPG